MSVKVIYDRKSVSETIIEILKGHRRVRIAKSSHNSARREEENDVQVAVPLIGIYFPGRCYAMIFRDTISP
jgi:hypothetical protein